MKHWVPRLSSGRRSAWEALGLFVSRKRGAQHCWVSRQAAGLVSEPSWVPNPGSRVCLGQRVSQGLSSSNRARLGLRDEKPQAQTDTESRGSTTQAPFCSATNHKVGVPLGQPCFPAQTKACLSVRQCWVWACVPSFIRSFTRPCLGL